MKNLDFRVAQGKYYNLVFTLQQYFMVNYISFCKMKHNTFLEGLNTFIASFFLPYTVEMSWKAT